MNPLTYYQLYYDLNRRNVLKFYVYRSILILIAVYTIIDLLYGIKLVFNREPINDLFLRLSFEQLHYEWSFLSVIFSSYLIILKVLFFMMFDYKHFIADIITDI